MSLQAGTRLGTYEVRALIGAGGMGEVYEAHDSKLDRDVAIKVLPEQFARDSERLARFQREAKMLAALNHPNIAAIYGLEQSESTHYLVMELVPGETLRERVAGGRPVPVEEALTIARQIAEALEAAHGSEKGIIHRDLKPANVKVTPEGRVKVLDFGLAKAFAAELSMQDMSNSPTLSAAPTMQGVIMGTAAYMSPEQARGKAVTKSTDIFAFGSVLYELLTGKQAFQGEDVGDILATVVKTEPDWGLLPKSTPPAIRMLLKRCLRKDKRQRLQDAAGIRIEIEDVLSGASPATAEATAAAAPRQVRERLAWAVAAAAILAAIGLAAFTLLRTAPETVQPVRFFLDPPDTWNFTQQLGPTSGAPNPLAVSPDGQRIAFIATGADGKSQLWVRSLDTLTAQHLAGTDGAVRPFWSPESRFLGFFADGKLKKIDISGGPAIALCDASDDRGGTWSQDGVIVYAAGNFSALMRVSEAGGAPTAVTTLGEGETAHRRPVFLPDGRHFLYYAVGGPAGTGGVYAIYVASLGTAERKLLFNADSQVLYSQGHLLFLRETTLMAQAFDAQRLELTGDAFPIAESIQTQGNPPTGVFSVSANGVLAYQTGTGTTGTQLRWFDRSGKQIGVLGEPAVYADLELSPDGTRAAVSVLDPAVNARDIWLVDIARGLRTRLTSDPANESVAIWSPDGRSIVFDSNRSGNGDLYQKAAAGVGSDEAILQAEGNQRSFSWSRDGRYLLYQTNEGAVNNLWALPLFGDRKPFPFLQTPFQKLRAKLSPDGRWVAYDSNETGRYEVYVTAFPKPESKSLISSAGGSWPRWRRDGKEIFYLDGNNDTVMAVEVDGQDSIFKVGAEKPLFGIHAAAVRYSYDVTADGQRFLVNSLPEQAAQAPMTVVLNWTAGVRK